MVKLDGKTGFINEDGEEIVPCKYDDASNSRKDLQVLKLKVYGDLSTKMVKSQYHANTRWYMIFPED